MESKPLPLVPPETLLVYKNKRPMLVQQAVAQILKYQDWQTILGPNAEDILTSGMSFTAETLESIMAVSTPAIIDQQVSWGKDYLTGVGIAPQMVLKNLEILADVLNDTLPRTEYPELSEWMQMMIDQQRKLI